MGFTRQTLEFLSENRRQNHKMWFEAHKADYQTEVVAPLAALTRELAPELHAIDNELICIPAVGKSISRIYRDTRFSKDKSLYRDVMWCVFMRDKKLYHGLPGYFFELSPRGFRYGCGYYQADTDSMEAIRRLILNRDQSFAAALKSYEKQDIFAIEGDLYKKSRYPEEDERLRNWLDRKNICLIHNSRDFNLLFSETLAQTVAAHYRMIAPIYDFLIKAESVK